MFSHVSLGTNDLARALDFYDRVLATLGARRCALDPLTEAVGYGIGPHFVSPLIFIGRPMDGAPAATGNGQTVAFEARTRAIVHRWHAAALQSGGTNEGNPGPRPHYHQSYYGAYVRDPDGNKLCCVCHRSDSLPSG